MADFLMTPNYILEAESHEEAKKRFDEYVSEGQLALDIILDLYCSETNEYVSKCQCPKCTEERKWIKADNDMI